ncbi:MAG: site-specific integrase [Syntrophaceae bacterium]|nr:site-specific integrase [Syntrophaceae bacterium]
MPDLIRTVVGVSNCPPAPPLFEDFADKYLEWSKAHKNRHGIEDYSRYENHLKDRFSGKRLDQISPFDLEKMKSEMAPKTISHGLGLLRSMINRARDWGLYDGENPVQRVKKPVIQNERQRFLSLEEIDLLLKALKMNPRTKKPTELKDPVLHDMALFSLHTGARAGEIFKLRGRDLDFKNGLIALVDTKNTNTRYVFMTESLRAILDRCRPEDPNDFVFRSRNGEMIKEISNAFQRVVVRIGFNNNVTDRRHKVTFHTLRHTFCSHPAIQGETLQTIAELAGHKTLQMVKQYSHLSEDHKRGAALNLEKRLNFKKEQNNVVPITAGGNDKNS